MGHKPSRGGLDQSAGFGNPLLAERLRALTRGQAAPAPASAPERAGDVARSPEPGPEPASLTGDPPLDLAACGKLVLRRERKGRGGRTVTVIAGLLLPAPGLAEVARRLRRALGCGASVEGATIVLQGDLGERAAEWLTARGARRVVRG